VNHKPRSWLRKAWSRMCQTASVARALHPMVFALIDILLVVLSLWLIVEATT